MTPSIFVNLPVKDLKRSVAFFTALGYGFNPQFTNEQGTCMIVSENIYVMLLVEKFFQTFTEKNLVDAKAATEAILALSHDSREAVDGIIAKAVAAGGRTYREPTDHGFMYQHAFEDPDGHLWEHFWMDAAYGQK